jgi:folate-dependent phosphoribosylglycinamide formyltransferase PurN
LLFNLYQRLDARIFRPTPDAFALEDMSVELAGVRAITAVPSRPKPFEHRFSANTVEEIREARLDVAVRFGFNIIRGDILDVARYGVWSYHHGDHRDYRGVPAFFWEMYEGNPVSGTMLQVLDEQLDAGRVLYRSFSATDKLSLNRGRKPPGVRVADRIPAHAGFS